MKVVCIIPARYESSRFPGKPLAKILDKPMIQWVYEAVSSVEKIDEVYVATDDLRIFNVVNAFGGIAVMTSKKHTCGTDRIAEASEILGLDDEDLILNIQGDEPLVNCQMIEMLIKTMDDDSISLGTLKHAITDISDLDNNNVVKVVCNKNNEALLFSRSRIPFVREKQTITFYKHIGVYAYKKAFLLKYSSMERTELETAESLEQLRVLENGYKIKVLTTEFESIGVDTEEQLAKVEDKLRRVIYK